MFATGSSGQLEISSVNLKSSNNNAFITITSNISLPQHLQQAYIYNYILSIPQILSCFKHTSYTVKLPQAVNRQNKENLSIIFQS